MRRDVAPRIICALTLALVAGLALSPVARAQDDCEQACLDQWKADVQDCKDALESQLAELAAAEQQCRDDHPNDPVALVRCLRVVKNKTHVANRDYRRCVAEANTRGWNCWRDCQQSPSRP